MFKKKISILTIGCLAIQSLALPVSLSHAATGGRFVDCVITGYYSPLPGQSRYSTGTYNGDIRLNGRGTNGASGREVFQGMIAAPKDLAFGTKVHIPGYGIGEVQDRGGAIIKYAIEEDVVSFAPIEKKFVYRFDIWLGHGDTGLTRALQLGLRKEVCQVFPKGSTVANTISFANTPPPRKKNGPIPRPIPSYTPQLAQGNKGEHVSDLQRKLKAAGLYDHDITGNFGPLTYSALVEFQLQHGIISSRTGWGAGVVGPKTRKALASGKVFDKPKVSTPVTPEVINQPEVALDVLTEAEYIIAAGLGKNATGREVKKLQYLLASLGHYNAQVSGEYNYATIEAVISFQKAKRIINNDSDWGAGHFGPKTQRAIKQEIAGILHRMNKYPSDSTSQFGTITQAVIASDFENTPREASSNFSSPETNEIVFGSFDPEDKVKKIQRAFKPSHFSEAMFVVNPFFTKTVEFKETSSEVQKIQVLLKKHGYFPIDTDTTGYFGNVTKETIMRFQENKGIEITGNVNDKTMKVLNELVLGWN